MSKITVKSKKPGFRRAGYAFSDTEPTVLDTADLSVDQLEAIKTDPGLIVVEGEDKKASSNNLKAEQTEIAEKRKALDEESAALAKEREALAAEKAELAKEREAFAAEKAAAKSGKK